MNEGFDDLLPMFLVEAGERLDLLARLLASTTDEKDLIRARRELHALKGASRMLGLSDFAALCHRAETLLEDPTTQDLAEVRDIHRRLTAVAEGGMVLSEDDLASADGTEGRVPPDAAKRETAGQPPADVRVPSGVIDGLSEKSARMRVLSVGSAHLVDRVFRLAHLAESAVGEPAPRQVLATLATSLRQLGVEFDAGQRRLQRLSEGLLDALLRQQVRPLRPVLESLARHARELAESLEKELRVSIRGGKTQLDRRIISGLQEVLVHVVRNAVDHGIENPGERSRVGKDSIGEVHLEARSEGDRVRLRVTDDGRGIDLNSVVRTATERGILTPKEFELLDEKRMLQLLCRPGFSTRSETTDLSGRGIGLDAVASLVHALGGDLWIDSRAGIGTTVTVEVPIARRGENAVVLRVGQALVALPAAPIRSYRRLSETETVTEGHLQFLLHDGERVPLRQLAELAGGPSFEPGVAVIGTMSGALLAVAADSVIGSEEVFLRPMPSGVGAPAVFDGMAVLANGRPVPVLSWQRMASLHRDTWSRVDGGDHARAVRVLLVDDSRVTREMIRRLLEDAGFAVTPSGSAEEARDLLSGFEFDCLITDIEMPATDGLQLTRQLRADERFVDLPIIVVSTRGRPSDHRAGMDAGADAYISKQGLDARDLIGLVRRAVGGGR